MKTLTKKVSRTAYSVISLAALAAVNYSIIHNTFVFVCIIVLLAHELGHYFAAKAKGGNPELPLFIPLPFIAVAITKITGLDEQDKATVAMYGPFAGFVTALSFLLMNTFFAFTSSISLAFLAAGELVFNWIGSDGSKYRKARKAKLCHF